MKEFFTKKRAIIIGVLAVLVIVLAIVTGINISNKQKLKQREAAKANYEQSIADKKKLAQEVKAKEKELNKTEKEIEEGHYTDEYKEYLELPDDKKKEMEVIPEKEKVDYEELDKIKENQEEDLGIISSIPAKFDLRDKIKIEIKNQYSFGLCWDFASIKTLETNLALRKGEYYDFSESHVDLITSNELAGPGAYIGRAKYEGGHFETFLDYMNRNKGIVLEETVPLSEYSEYEYNTFYTTPSVDIVVTKVAKFPAFRKDNFEEEEQEEKFKEYQDTVKTHIMNYGGLYCVIDAPDFGANHYLEYGFDNYKYKEQTGQELRNSHAVTIIGWDDNYSRNNFKSPLGAVPSKDGAYIAASSWGEYSGYNGYYYISYEDRMVHDYLRGIVSTDIEDAINVSKLENQAIKKYIMENYSDFLMYKSGNAYIRQDIISASFLNLSNIGLKNLKDIEIFGNNFYSINLSNNQLENIVGIDKIMSKELSDIDLSNNKLEDINGLEKYMDISNSYGINLSNNNIKDISNISEYKFYNFDLSENYGISGYENIKECTQINLSGCGLKNLDGLANMQENLEYINIANNNIEDYSTMNFDNVIGMDMSGNNLEDLSKISGIKSAHMYSINLSNNNLKDISMLKDLDCINIDLSDNTEIEDFSAIRENTNIYSITLKNCNIKDAEQVKNIKEIPEFYMEELGDENFNYDDYFEGDDEINFYGVSYNLSYNTGIYNLDKLTNATSLILKACNIEDVNEINSLEALQTLDLSENENLKGKITNSSIVTLYLDNCNLTDVKDLIDTEIYMVSLYGNDIDVNSIENITFIQVDRANDKIEEEERIYEYGQKEIEARTYEYTIEIPSNKDVDVNISTWQTKYGWNDKLYIDGKPHRSIHPIITINKDTQIVRYNWSGEIGEIYNIIVNPELESKDLIVTKAPTKLDYSINDLLDKRGMEVYSVYNAGVMTKINDYDVGTIKSYAWRKGAAKVSKDNLKTYVVVNAKDATEMDDEFKEETEEDKNEENNIVINNAAEQDTN